MGASLTNALQGSHISYFNFEPPDNLSEQLIHRQSFTQDGTSFTILHIYSQNITMIYLIKIHGLLIESFKRENYQFHFIFNFCYDNKLKNQNAFDFQTLANFSVKQPFIILPNLAVPFKISMQFVEDESEVSFFTPIKSICEKSIKIIPETYNFISSLALSFSLKILHSFGFKAEEEKEATSEKFESINEQLISEIKQKDEIDQNELHILQTSFSLDDVNQIPYSGIDNLGLTCYISASLHFLSSVTPFVELLLNTKAKKGTTARELQKVFAKLKMASIVSVKKAEKDLSNHQVESQNGNKNDLDNEINNEKTSNSNSNKNNDNSNTNNNNNNSNDNKNNGNLNENVNSENCNEDVDSYESSFFPINSSCLAFSCISIREFVASFGNINKLIYNEQDAHEFITILFDRIDSELGDQFAKKRKEIFDITSVTFVKCKNVDYEKEIEEELSDITLPLTGGCRSIKMSLDEVTSNEEMEGDDMWDTGEKFGKQEAVLHRKFRKLPPFLTFHLMRYTELFKVETYFKCPERIDMKKYLIKKDENNETRYKLMSIIAHRGSLHSGHYVSYLSPNVNGNWFLFNDSSVMRSSFKEVQETFGCSSSDALFDFSGFFHASNDFYTYIVGYVRLDYIEKMRYGLTVPIEVVPNALIMKYSALLLDETQSLFIFDGKDFIEISSSAKGDFCNRHLMKSSDSKGFKFEWSDTSKTIEYLMLNLFSQYYDPKIAFKSNEQFKKMSIQEFFNEKQVYVHYLDSNRIIGPIKADSKASDYTLSCHETQFIIIDKISDPVFLNGPVKTVESRRLVFSKYGQNFRIKYENRIIDDPNFEFPIGATIELKEVQSRICIKNTEYSINDSTTYEEIQILIATHVINMNRRMQQIKDAKNSEQKARLLDNLYDCDDEDLRINLKISILGGGKVDDHQQTKYNAMFYDEYYENYLFLENSKDETDPFQLAERIILTDRSGKIMIPRTSSIAKFPKIELDYKIAMKPITVNSIDLCRSISVEVVDLEYKKTKIPNALFLRENVIDRIFEWGRKICQKNEDSVDFVISSSNENKIKFIFDPNEKNYNFGKVRIDILKTKFPAAIEDYKKVLDMFGMAPIEVRLVLYMTLSKSYNSLGFFYFGKNESYGDLFTKIENVVSSFDVDIVLTQSITVQTEDLWFRGYKVTSMQTGIFDSFLRIQKNVYFSGQRPIITIQVHKKSFL